MIITERVGISVVNVLWSWGNILGRVKNFDKRWWGKKEEAAGRLHIATCKL